MGEQSQEHSSAFAVPQQQQTQMQTQPSLKAVKGHLFDAVTRTIGELMESYGYSRDRAVTCILRELTNTTTEQQRSLQEQEQQQHQSDDEIFDAMRRYGIGSQQAARALAIAALLKQNVLNRGLSTVGAVWDLIHKLEEAKQKLALYGDSDDQSDDNESIASVKRATSPDAESITQANTTSMATESTASSQSKSNVQRPQPASTTKLERASSRSSIKVANNTGKKAVVASKVATTASTLSKNGKTTGKPNLPRKRSMDDSSAAAGSNNNNQQQMPAVVDLASSTSTRPRSDSVTEAVSAKLTDANPSAAAAEPQKPVAVPASPAIVRKRGRPSAGEDMDLTSKRSRQTTIN